MPLSRLRAEIFDHEQARDQPMRSVGDRDRAGFRRRLHPRGDIGRVAEDLRLVAGAAANHHRARIDPDPGGELRMSRLFVELRDRVENRQARARRTLGVVVVRRGPAEVGHHAVAEILRDVPVEAGYRFGRRAMKSREGLAPFLGIEPGGDRGRADQVAEQHRQMTPLTIVPATLLGCIAVYPNIRTRCLADRRGDWLTRSTRSRSGRKTSLVEDCRTRT